MSVIVNRFKDGNSVARNAAEAFFVKMDEVLATKAEAHVAITGGTVGIATLGEIAANERAANFDFNRVNFWWGDERFVDADSADRNAIQAKKSMLNKLPTTNLHEFPASDQGMSLDEAANFFAAELAAIKPHFSLALVGMGPDGHICSLFPGKPAIQAGVQVIAEHDSPKPPAQRLSFSYEAMNSVDELWKHFLDHGNLDLPGTDRLTNEELLALESPDRHHLARGIDRHDENHRNVDGSHLARQCG